MKFKIIQIFIFLYFILNPHFTYCNKSKASTKRSMMGYLNALFSPKNPMKSSENLIKKSENLEYDRNRDNYRFKEPDIPRDRNYIGSNTKIMNNPIKRFSQMHNNYFRFNEKPMKIENTNKKNIETTPCMDKINRIDTNEEIIFQGWYMISSQLFLDRKIFPIVESNDGKEMYIHVDANLFRINDSFFALKNDKPPSKRDFWFRMTKLIIYYSVSEKDVNILGAIPLRDIINIKQIEETFIEIKMAYCFIVIDQIDNNWKLCSYDRKKLIELLCYISKILNFSTPECYKTTKSIDHIEVKEIIQPVIIVPLPSRDCNDDWNYQKQGADWECGCTEGHEQSPIDLPNKLDTIDSAVTPSFFYNTMGADLVDIKNIKIEGTIKQENILFTLRDNALKIIYSKIGKLTTTNGSVFNGQEIVFHTPSEHTIENIRYEMEVKIIHTGDTEIGNYATLSFLVKKAPGIYNQFFDQLNIFSLPNRISKDVELIGDLYLPKIFYEKTAESDDDVIKPDWKPFSLYTYQGSLTTPPCSENTIVYVAAKPIRLGSTAISLFQEALRMPDFKNSEGDIITSDLIPISNRMIQPRNRRPVFYYDHTKYCLPEPVPKPTEEGHYEKVTAVIDKYFYVSNDKASGLPHSFLVGKNEATGIEPNSHRTN
jgi:carbonic anhydrase